MMDDYKPNSHKFREEQKDVTPERKKTVEKVVRGQARIKKKNKVGKFADSFISEDVHTVGNYILKDVLVPAIKDFIEDSITNGIRMILRGETGSRKNSSTASTVSYNRYYNNKDGDRYRPSNNQPTVRSYDDIIFDTRGDAELVLTKMDEMIDYYGIVSVADMYEMAELPGEYTYNEYGWNDIRSASIVRVREGYMIKLPRATPIKNMK